MKRPGICAVLALVLCLWVGSAPAEAGAARQDFSGSWVLDLAVSDPPDELLEAQGANILMRTAARSMEVRQDISVGPTEVSLSIESKVKSDTQQLITDNTVRTRDSKRGPAQVRHHWTADDALVSIVVTTTAGGTEQTTIQRTLSADGRTMTQRITFEHAGGTVVATRIFRRS